MFANDTKQIKRIIDRSKRYPDIDMRVKNEKLLTYDTHEMVFSVDIENDHIVISVKYDWGEHFSKVVLTQESVTYYGKIFIHTMFLDFMEQRQENLINEIKKPLDYKLNKLYKLIFRRIVSKGLYQDHTDKYNVYLVADSVTQNKNDLTVNVNSHHRFEFKHPMSGLVLGTVDWWYDKGNHKGMYHGDEQTSKNINDIIALLME